MKLRRRDFLKRIAQAATLGGAAMVTVGSGCRGVQMSAGQPFFLTRGVVLVPGDLTLVDWPERAKKAGLTTIALHHGSSPKVVSDFIVSEEGQRFLAASSRLGLQVEYELHAMSELLPRGLFEKDQSLFRRNEKGDRAPDSNLCVHSGPALEIAAENAVTLGRTLRPTTGRYFYWGDDGKSWCQCAKCAPLSDSDQALILENHLLKALRRVEPRAQVAHLAYANTLRPPTTVKPEAGVFLELAPIEMRHRHPSARYSDPESRPFLQALDANLEVFPRDTAQALEYWLDVSMQSEWRKPARKLVLDESALAVDLGVYGSRGIRHVTTFAVFLDADYVKSFGNPTELETYGAQLSR